MKQVTLEAKTHAGKNKLSKTASLSCAWDGNWNVVEERDAVGFSNEKGPWLFLSPAMETGDWAMTLSRWVHATDDANFIVRSNVQIEGRAAFGASRSNAVLGRYTRKPTAITAPTPRP